MDHLNLQTEKEIYDFIESQKDNIEKVLENCLDKESFRMAQEEGFESIDEFILSVTGDFFRECMCGVGIPGWDNDE